MNNISKPGDRVVFTGKSGYIVEDFEGYDILEVGKSYIIEDCFRVSEYSAVDDLDNWRISIVGITQYGYALDCFEPLSNIRKEKLNNLLD